jgi:hypothetical protein
LDLPARVTTDGPRVCLLPLRCSAADLRMIHVKTGSSMLMMPLSSRFANKALSFRQTCDVSSASSARHLCRWQLCFGRPARTLLGQQPLGIDYGAEFFKEGHAFLSSGDSSEPVVLIGRCNCGKGLTKYQLGRVDRTSRDQPRAQVLQRSPIATGQIKDPIGQHHIDRGGLYRDAFRGCMAKGDVARPA